ncbi:hypothetical protein HUT18_11720 [Streptomyces sp. NA04227]|uniref:hypothetical protein n=1 Tax=Streptomyces sp. NA04227 TaxID=2742136 RepID=UPI001592A80D|nr:hypothetical protein [Streptomyces sp. NA04227]QKW06966.1 hypothetical protein HUT18_11720 [Streptomyces sp. NA04227]
MAAVLEPTEQMSPWYVVEVRRESAYVTAAKYMDGYLRKHFHQGKMTGAERDAAWQLVDKRTVAAPGEPLALVAALEQIVEHGSYQKWWRSGSHADGAGAELRDGRLLVTAPNSHQYGEYQGEKAISHIEFGYEDIGPVLADLRRIVGS